MKKNSHILVGTILITSLMASMLSGCGRKDDEKLPQQISSEQTDMARTEDEVSEKDKLTVWSAWDISDQFSNQKDAYYWQEIEKNCNVELEFVDTSGGKDSLSILIGTEDLPDLIIDWETTLPGGIDKALADGSIIPLNHLMEEGKLPNLKSYLQQDPEVDKLCKNDEGLYPWAPMIRKPDSPLLFSGNLIRQDWLDELGLEVPETLSDMENVLLEFKEKKGCDSAFSFSWNDYGIIVHSFGVSEDMYLDGDLVKYGFMEDNYREFLKLFRHWMEEGIVDPDGFTQNIDAFYAKVATGRTGLIWGFTGSLISQLDAMKKENPEMNYQPIPNPVLNSGDTFLMDISASRINNFGTMISSTCQNTDAAARVIDYFYSEEGTVLSNYGVEGESFEYQDGKPVFTDFVLHNPDGLSIQTALSLYAGSNNKSFLVEKGMMNQLYALEEQKKSLEVWAAPKSEIRKMPPVSLTSEEVEEYNSIMMDINTYVNEYKMKFILGTESLDKFEQFKEDLRKMGIERAIEIQQNAYNRFCER